MGEGIVLGGNFDVGAINPQGHRRRMGRNPLEIAAAQIRALASTQHANDQGDGELLRAYAADDDQSAFRALVRRHGPLVLAVCKRILHHEQDAEDAFQAVFIVLARKATSVRGYHSLAGWLHQVSHRIALAARRAALRRRRHESEAKIVESTDPALQAAWREVQTLLDEEIQRLHAKYREPFVLCCLQNLSCAQAAARLGVKEGTIWSRLTTARKRLQGRLTQRGVILSAALGAVAIGSGEASASLPVGLAAKATRAALASKSGTLLAGVVSDQVAALVRGATTSLAEAKISVGVALILSLGGLVGVAGLYGSNREPEAALARAPGPQDKSKTEPERKDAPQPTRMDRYGDPLPEGASARLGTVRFRTGGSIYGCATSPDGRVIAAATVGGRLVLFDASSGVPLAQGELTFRTDMTAVAFAPDGKTIATGGWNPEITLWHPGTGARVGQFVVKGKATVNLMFTPDSSQILSNHRDGMDKDGVAILSDATTGQEVHRFPDCHGMVAINKDGRTLASGAKDGTIQLWDLNSGKRIRRLEGAASPVNAVAFSNDGQLLVSGDKSGQIRIWEIASGKEKLRIAEKRENQRSLFNEISSVAFSPDGQSLAAGDDGYNLGVWDASTGKRIHLVLSSHRSTLHAGSYRGGIHTISFSQSGSRLVWAEDSRIRELDLSSQLESDPSQENCAAVMRMQMSSDGRTLVTLSDDQTHRLTMWDLKTHRQIRQLQGQITWINNVALSPDAKLLASQVNDGRAGPALVLYDTTTGKEHRRLPLELASQFASLERATFSPDGRFLAAGSMRDGTIRLWNVATGHLDHALAGHPDHVSAIAFSPDGRSLASAGGDLVIRIYDLATGKTLRSIQNDTAWTMSLVFSPDGGLLASAANNGFVRVWETTTGRLLRTMRIYADQRSIAVLAFSPDGRMLAVAGVDGVVRLAEVATGSIRRTFLGHRGPVEAVAFTPDGRSLISGSEDTTALVWDVLGLPAKLSAEKLNTEWDELRSDDGTKAFEAICRLAHDPDKSLPMLRGALIPATAEDPMKLKRLIAELDDEKFAKREMATSQLQEMEDRAEAALRACLQNNPSPESIQRVDALLKELETGSAFSKRMQAARALEILEFVGTAEARQLLEKLANGAAEARLTQEAKVSLERLVKRASAIP
jgi:RNA polymerase sigma factor (sigma-70 family)